MVDAALRVNYERHALADCRRPTREVTGERGPGPVAGPRFEEDPATLSEGNSVPGSLYMTRVRRQNALAAEASVMAHDGEESMFIGPASARDAAEGYRWGWVAAYRGERRSGACATREQAQAEAASVLELLRDRPYE
jgi:hypothetical protein